MIGLKGFATIWIKRLSGERELITDCVGGPKPNRILDSGLDMPASYYFADCVSVFSVGSDNTATTDTMTKLVSYVGHSTNYVTGENGTLLKDWDGNWVSDSNDASPPCRIYRTCEVWTNETGSDQPIGELGFGPEDTTDPDLFSRIALSSLVTVANGESIIVRYTLEIDYSFYYYADDETNLTARGYGPIRTTQLGEIGDLWAVNDNGTGANDGGRACLITPIQPDGSRDELSTYKKVLEPSHSSSLQSIITTDSNSDYGTVEVLSYTPGDHCVTKRAVFGNTTIIGDVEKIRIRGYYSGYNNWANNSICFTPDSPITKALGETLTHDFVISWGRA